MKIKIMPTEVYVLYKIIKRPPNKDVFAVAFVHEFSKMSPGTLISISGPRMNLSIEFQKLMGSQITMPSGTDREWTQNGTRMDREWIINGSGMDREPVAAD